MTCATQVPRNGTAGSFAKNRLMAFLREIGYEYSPVILKSDGEPAVKAVVYEVALARGAMRTINEESPKGSSGSNGIVEKGDFVGGAAGEGDEVGVGGEMGSDGA